MFKVLPLILLGIFAPPLTWMAIGGQLIYASHQARCRRLATRTQELIQAHCSSAPSA